MNGCPHCVKFSPIWDSFKQSYKGNVQLLKKERGEAGDELRKYKVQGFPTIILVDENDNTIWKSQEIFDLESSWDLLPQQDYKYKKEHILTRLRRK